MNSSKHPEKRHHSDKEKKLMKLIKPSSESEDDGIEHELSYYLNDRVKLMREVLKMIKPKKIRSMAPDCMKNMDNEEINSILLEELLGISNKRLKYIFSGQTLNEESSSTDPGNQTAVDIISLDDISDDDLIIDLDSDTESRQRIKLEEKMKREPKKKKLKREKRDKDTDTNKKLNPENPMSEKNLMSVLELLELQARARAIKSQLVLENQNVIVDKVLQKASVDELEEDDAVIVESPKNVEIVITSSETEDEDIRQNGESSWKNSAKSSETVNSNDSGVKESANQKELEESGIANAIIIQQTTVRQYSQNGSQSSQNTYSRTSIDIQTDADAKNSGRSEESTVLNAIQDEISRESGTTNESDEEIKTNSESDNKNNQTGGNDSTKLQRSPENDQDEANHLKDSLPITNVKAESEIMNPEGCESEREKERETHRKEKEKTLTSLDDSESIVINLEQSEIDCLN